MVDDNAKNLDPLTWPTTVARDGEVDALQLRYLQAGGGRRERNGAPYFEGFVLWGCDLPEGRKVGVRWEWIEVQRGVLAIANPLCIRSNLCLLDSTGNEVPPRLAILKLNLLVYMLDWQNKVLSEIDAIGLGTLACC